MSKWIFLFAWVESAKAKAMKKLIILSLLTLSSCIPFKKEPIETKYVNKSSPFKKTDSLKSSEEETRLKLEKELEWNQIVEEAVEKYEDINPLITKKCASCHDSDKPLPFYGKIYPKKNIFKKHRDDGLDSVNFYRKFPWEAKGNPSQLSLLKAVRAAVVERTMPIKMYTAFYPFRKITNKDEDRILAWIDPLIERIEAFNLKYETKIDDSPEGRASKVFEQSCNRCHGHGNDRGGFSNLDDLKLTAKSKFVNINEPEKSEIYELAHDGMMPPSKSQRLSEEEIQTILDWIRSLKK